jgi:Zn-finger nucleic acid-binding protein
MATMPCPRCAAQLSEHRKGDARLDACDGCGGVWLDAAAAKLVIERVQGSLPLVVLAERAATLAGVEPDRDAPARCPFDAEPMARLDVDGVTVDTCKVHGTWFDAGEVRRIANAYTSTRPEAAPAYSKSSDSDTVTIGGFFSCLLDALDEI